MLKVAIGFRIIVLMSWIDVLYAVSGRVDQQAESTNLKFVQCRFKSGHA